MKFWEMATGIELKKRAPTVLLTLQDNAREAILEMDANTLNQDDGMKKLYEKLNSKLFNLDSIQNTEF